MCREERIFNRIAGWGLDLLLAGHLLQATTGNSALLSLILQNGQRLHTELEDVVSSAHFEFRRTFWGHGLAL